MTPLILWTIIALLVGILAVLQFVGVRALETWGVRPSKAVIGLRAFNMIVVIGLIVLVFIVWMGR